MVTDLTSEQAMKKTKPMMALQVMCVAVTGRKVSLFQAPYLGNVVCTQLQTTMLPKAKNARGDRDCRHNKPKISFIPCIWRVGLKRWNYLQYVEVGSKISIVVNGQEGFSFTNTRQSPVLSSHLHTKL